MAYRWAWPNFRVKSVPFHRLLWIAIALRAWATSVSFKYQSTTNSELERNLVEPIEAKMRSPKRGGREILRELTTPPEGSDSNKSTELPTVNPTKLIWAEQILTTIRCGGEFAPGEETLLGIEPGKFHQANVSIIDNLFTEFMVRNPCQRYTPKPRPRLKLPKTRRKRRKALHRILQRLYKQDMSKAAALIVSGEWKMLDKSTQLPMDTLEAFWQPLLETSSRPDERTAEQVHETAWNSMQPITLEDIEWSLDKSNSRMAPGPDGCTIPSVKGLPRQELVVLFNNWLLSHL